MDFVPASLFLLFLLVVAVIAAGIISSAANRASSLDTTYQKLAERFQGTSRPGGFFGRPSAHFHYQGAPVRIDVFSTGGKHPKYYTQCHIQWPDRHFRCEVYPEQFWNRLGKLLGMKDIEIGSPQFDPLYIITGNDHAEIRRLLTPNVQAQIHRLRQFRHNDDIYVSIGNGMLLVKKLELLRNLPDLLQFTQLALELYDQALATRATGIEFLAAGPAENGQGTCQVCGEEIQQDVVWCRSCKTPHHRDCWQYFGACSIYGCGQTVFVNQRERH